MEPNDTSSSISVYSDCDCYLCQFGINCHDLEPYPFCTAARHPQVYYAQCRHGKKRDCSECKRPNCFVRAFRWYTNEHGPPRQKGKPCQVTEPCKEPCTDDCKDDKETTSSNEPNMSAFAVWLDSKYDQFMMENAVSKACRMQLTQTSLIESCHPDECNQPQSGPCGKKRFSRVKSHWKHRISKHHEKEYHDQERNQHQHQAHHTNPPSMEFILPPKNLSRAASDCCHPSPSCSVDHHHHVAKSRSATATVCLNRSGYEKEDFDKPPIEQKHVKSKGKALDYSKNASCQVAKPAGQNAQTQYETPCHSITSTTTSPFAVTPTLHEKYSKKSMGTNLEDEPNGSMKHKDRSCKMNSNVLCQCPPETNVQTEFQNTSTIGLHPDSQKTNQANRSMNKKVSNVHSPCTSITEPRPAFRQPENIPQSKYDAQVQNRESSPNDIKPCPDFQEPCPSLGENVSHLPTACPSLKEPCLGRKPCPSFRKPCPPCPNTNLSKTSTQQYQQTVEPIPEPRLQQQPYLNKQQAREQAPQLKFDSQTQHPDMKPMVPDYSTAGIVTPNIQRDQGPTSEPLPKQEELSFKSSADMKLTLRECCTASAIQREQGPIYVDPLPTVIETPPKQENLSFKSYTDTKVTLRDCCTANVTRRDQGPSFVEPLPTISRTPPKQEELSLKTCAVNVGNQQQCPGPCMPGPPHREMSTGVDVCLGPRCPGPCKTCSSLMQGMPTCPNQRQTSLECHCLNCYQSRLTYDTTGYYRRNESVPPLISHQNVIISTTDREGKCSVNCPYYMSISNKGQITQTTVQSQSKFSDSTVQTSNTAIRLDRGTILEYPLFMRVVCADKLQ